MFDRGDVVKYLDLPLSSYSTWPSDKIRLGEKMVGVSTFSGCSYNERSMLSLAAVDTDLPIGTDVVVVWGEEERGSFRPVVERHRQARIRAIVSPCPYSEAPRRGYAPGWRTLA